MQVFISADMEGVTGVTAAADVVKDNPEYKRGQRLMHGDVNAAVEGAVAAGADEVLVNDAHSTMRNLDRESIDERATLVRGNTKPRSMMQGLTDDHDVALFVGYHAMAGTAGAVLNHTILAYELRSLSLNGREVGELGWNLRFGAALGVPVGLVTGDDATVAEADAEPGDPETAVVKDGIDRFSARCRPAAETQPEIRTAAERAVSRARDRDLSTPDVTGPTTVTADWATTNQAARAASTPGVERAGDRRTSVTAERYVEAYEAVVGMLRSGVNGSDDIYG